MDAEARGAGNASVAVGAGKWQGRTRRHLKNPFDTSPTAANGFAFASSATAFGAAATVVFFVLEANSSACASSFSA